MMLMEAKAWLGLGSNMGNKASNLKEAMDRLGEKVTIETVSSVYETDPVGFTDQPSFLNMACSISTRMTPFELLDLVKTIEKEMGRVTTFRNGPRPIDIDILVFADDILETETLTIPHPAITRRGFVLVPLAEIAGDVIHPVNGKRVRQLLAELDLSGQKIIKWGTI